MPFGGDDQDARGDHFCTISPSHAHEGHRQTTIQHRFPEIDLSSCRNVARANHTKWRQRENRPLTPTRTAQPSANTGNSRALGGFDRLEQLLTLEQLRVALSEADKLLMRALLDDATVVEHEDMISLAHGADAM